MTIWITFLYYILALAPGGVVIEEIPKGSALERAGVQSGDVLVEWQSSSNSGVGTRLPLSGTINSYFDWRWLRIEHAPRQCVQLRILRGSEELVLDVPQGSWDAKVYPQMPPGIWHLYAQGEKLIASENLAEGMNLRLQAAEVSLQSGNTDIACWLFLQIADAWMTDGQIHKAEEAWSKALRASRDPLVEIAVLDARGTAYEKRRLWKEAAAAHSSALDARRSIWKDENLHLAMSQVNLGTALFQQGEIERAGELYADALKVYRRLAPGSLELAKCLSNVGNIISLRGSIEEARAHHQEALEIRRALAPESLELASSLTNIAHLDFLRGDLEQASRNLRESLELKQRLAPDSLTVAAALTNLGGIEIKRNSALAEDLFLQALLIRERLAPAGTEMADNLQALGLLASQKGDRARAEDYQKRALMNRERAKPESLEVANDLNNLGVLVRDRGDLDEAESLHFRALAILEKKAPSSLQMAGTLANIGAIVWTRGENRLAEDYYLRSLHLREKLAPGSIQVAKSLRMLGEIYRSRGHLDLAERFFRQALAISNRVAPESMDTAELWSTIGVVTWLRGDLDAAIECYRRAFSSLSQIAPKSREAASLLNKLGALELERGELDAASKQFTNALEIAEASFLVSPTSASILHNLGAVAQLRGELDAAEKFYRRANATLDKIADSSVSEALNLLHLGEIEKARGHRQPSRKLLNEALLMIRSYAPGSANEASVLFALGELSHESGDAPGSITYYQQAIGTLDRQIGRIGAIPEAGIYFSSRHLSHYKKAIRTFLDYGFNEEAFHTFERYRARGLLKAMGERELLSQKPVSPELEETRQNLLYQYDKAQEALLAGTEGSSEVAHAVERIQAIKAEYEQIISEILRQSSRSGPSRELLPLDLPNVQQALDPGTTLLAFNVGDQGTDLFVLSREEPLRVIRLSLGIAQISQRIDLLRQLTAEVRSMSRVDASRRILLDSVAASLFSDLLAPVAASIERSERLFVIPDGPLHRLPWNSLISTQEEGGKRRFLIEWKPIHIVLSGTLFDELKQLRQRAVKTAESATPYLVAFGSPAYPSKPAASNSDTDHVDVRFTQDLQRGSTPSSLIASRAEVERIVALYPGTAMKYLDSEATEENALSVPRQTRIVHFAAHASVDERFPFNSGIILTLPESLGMGQANGFVQAWEIVERLRLDAELVVLSACESGLGKDLGGEGLIGLTRAFQYAGARSVLASLWKISDRTTAELMVRFYKHLKAGKTKDEALRAAQIELIHGPIEITNEKGEVEKVDASAPYYWAAFQLYGDWQ